MKILTNANAGALLVAFCCATRGFAAVDRSFNPGTGVAGGDEEGAHVVVPLRDGRILLGGDFGTFNGVFRPDLALLRPNGSLDESILLPGGVDGDEEPAIWSVGFQPDGNIIVSGNFRTVSGIARQGLARLHPNGALDTAWLPQVGSLTNLPRRSSVLSDGRVLVWNLFGLERLNADGSVDTTFDVALDGFVFNGVSVQSDGRILVAGYFFDPRAGVTGQKVVRLLANGSVDVTFTANQFVGPPFGAEQMPDGRVLVFGGFTSVAGGARPGLALLHADGRLDTTARFTGARDYVRLARPVSDGSIVAYSESVGPEPDALDVTVFTEPPRGQRLKGRPWSVEFTVFPNGYVYDIAEDARGRILIAGEFWELNGVRVPTGIARFVRRGQPFPSLGHAPTHRVGVPLSRGSVLLGPLSRQRAGTALRPNRGNANCKMKSANCKLCRVRVG